MKKLLGEFRDFIMTGNVIDLSVAVLLATAVGAVVSGFTQDIMMPFVGYFTGGIDFSDMKIVLTAATHAEDGSVITPENAIMYGKWINSVINLIIVGFVLFIIVKGYVKLKDLRKKKEEELLTQIRDELKNLNNK